MLPPICGYVFSILAMGLSCSADLFESTLASLSAGVKVVNKTDDIFVYVPHRKNMTLMRIISWTRCIDIDLHVNSDKCKANCKSVLFFSMKLMAGDLKPDPNNIKCTEDWPVPNNVTELQSFLESVTYLSHFIADGAQLRHLLQTLTEEKCWIHLDQYPQRGLQACKRHHKNNCLLQFNYAWKLVYIKSDVCQNGCGSVLQPDHSIADGTPDGKAPTNLRPTVYASKSLSVCKYCYPILNLNSFVWYSV